jgi:hypothetical protein
MVAASRRKSEVEVGSFAGTRKPTGTRKPAGPFRENMQYQQA